MYCERKIYIMKKIISLLIVLILFFALVGCGENNSILSDPNSPLKLNLSTDILTWNKIDNASGYFIYSGSSQLAYTVETSYVLNLKEGSYDLYVDAKVDGNFVGKSNKVTYKTDGSTYVDPAKLLASPSVELKGNKITWNQVRNASSYDIYVDGSIYTNVTSASYMFSLDEGSYEVYVVAKGSNGYVDSKQSNIVTLYATTGSTSGTINIFEINDTHGACFTDDSVSGMEKVGSIINSLEDQDGDYIKIANGDIFQGGYVSNMTKGACFIDCLNALDFDCFVIGNHDFDWGFDEIAKYKDGILSNGEADFPFLGANIYYKNTSTRPEWLDEYVIVENDGLKVGVIGVIGQYLESSILTKMVEDYEFVNPTPIVSSLAKKLRTEESCDVVVVSIHEYEDYTLKDFASLKGDSRIDAIICGHTHQKISEYVRRSDGYQIPVIQSYTKNICVGTISIEYTNGNVTDTSMQHYYASSYIEDKEILAIKEDYSSYVTAGEAVIYETSTSLSKYDLGILACNAMAECTGCDFGCMNTGGVRTTITTNKVKARDILEVFPFDNEVYKVTLTGKQLKKLNDENEDYLYFSTNLDFSKLESSKTYTIAIIDYVFTGEYYDDIFNGCTYEALGCYIRDCVIESLSN